jgi:hypothetical protein
VGAYYVSVSCRGIRFVCAEQLPTQLSSSRDTFREGRQAARPALSGSGGTFRFSTSHLKKKILARNQGISELKTAGNLEVVEDFQGGLTQSPGQKTFLRWLVHDFRILFKPDEEQEKRHAEFQFP